jgi:hypothetical protein
VISIIFRFTERGDGGASGPTKSGPSAIGRENQRFRLKFGA